MALGTFVNVGDQPVGVDDLGGWIARCEAHQAELTALSDDDLRKRHTLVLVVRCSCALPAAMR